MAARADGEQHAHEDHTMTSPSREHGQQHAGLQAGVLSRSSGVVLAIHFIVADAVGPTAPIPLQDETRVEARKSKSWASRS